MIHLVPLELQDHVQEEHEVFFWISSHLVYSIYLSHATLSTFAITTCTGSCQFPTFFFFSLSHVSSREECLLYIFAYAYRFLVCTPTPRSPAETWLLWTASAQTDFISLSPAAMLPACRWGRSDTMCPNCGHL